MNIVLAELLGALLFACAPFLVSLFSPDADVIAYGTRQARIEAFLYFLVAFSHGSAGILRGDGKPFVPMLTMLGAWCIFRVIFVRTILSVIHDIGVIYIAYPVTWTLSSIAFIICLRRTGWIGRGKGDGGMLPKRR